MLAKLQQKKETLKFKAQTFFSPKEVVQITQAIMAAGITLTSVPMFAMAGADAMFGMLIGYVCKIFFYIGTILLVWAVGQLVLSFKNEDADSKSRAVMVLVCAVLLMSIGSIYDAVAGQMGGDTVNRSTNVSL